MVTTETIKKHHLPCAVLNRIVAFPGIPMTVDMDKGPAKKVFENAVRDGGQIFMVCQKDPLSEASQTGDIFPVGVIARVKQVVKTQSGLFRVIIEPQARAVLAEYHDEKIPYADVYEKKITEEDSELRTTALLRELRSLIEEFAKFAPKFSKEFWLLFSSIRDLSQACDFAAENLLPDHEQKQELLEEFSPCARAAKLINMLEAEKSILEERAYIKKEVDERMKKNQRDYYLREQLRVIHEELGENDEYDDDDLREYADRLEKGNYPEKVKEAITKEIKRLSRIPFGSAENTVLRNYIEVVLDIPFLISTEERIDIPEVKRILDEDHDGLEKVKERVIEYLAALKLNPELRGQIICLVGPPGTGKTSIATSIARAVNRKFVRVSLGGVHDEAEIRGHRKTYIGSMPGRIVNALIEAKSNNPLILFDEIDKMASDMRGDPASAMLEVLDREQNKTFRDHFVEMDVDLSRCMFIATANSLENIPKPLLDRMEIIELSSYTQNEKFHIAKDHLIPKQLKRHGLTKKALKISDEVIIALAEGYTAEAGVRNLEREIASLCRKAAKEIIENGVKTVCITMDNLESYLGARKFDSEKISEENEIGVVNGMAYTSIGGDLLKIEAAIMKGTGKVQLTGKLGEVMKESAEIAISFIRENAVRLGIDPDFYSKYDIHIHAPEGAVPKDGPSAGVTMTTALVSVLTSRPVRRDISMTGEITLRGKVLPIGGLKEKTIAAYSAGVKNILIPYANLKNLDEVDSVVKENVKFIPCKTIFDVLDVAFCQEEVIAIISQYAPTKVER